MKKIIGLLFPFFLIPSTWMVFNGAAYCLGKDIGYLVGFVFYWTVWGIGFPIALLGWNKFVSLYKDSIAFFRKGNWLVVLLFFFISFVALAMYGSSFISQPKLVLAVSFPVAIINGICEENIWRGVYIRLYEKGIIYRVVLPSVFFALSHISPLSVKGIGLGTSGFVISTFFLGLGYGWISHKTNNVKWTVISHSLNGVFATGGFIVPSLLAVIGN